MMRVVSHNDRDPGPGSAGGGGGGREVAITGSGLDVPRRRRKRSRWLIAGALVLAGAIGVTLAMRTISSSLPSVDRDQIWIGTVERGPLELAVQGQGTLVPEEIHWISAPMSGRVVRVLAQPGAVVHPDDVLLELSNPDAELAALDADRQVGAAKVALSTLQASLDGQVLAQESEVQTLESDRAIADHRAKIDTDMKDQGVVAPLTAEESAARSEQLAGRVGFEKRRLGALRRGQAAQIQAAKDQIVRLQQLADFRHRQVDELRLRAGTEGVLQELALQAGQSVAAGAPCAKVVKPDKLKAVLRVSELAAKDVAAGQRATVDLRTGKVEGTVARVDPAAENGTVKVDVALPAELPKGARPDLTVDGVIELEKTGDILHVQRPAVGDSHAQVAVFKVVGDEAVRVNVTFGRASVKDIEVVSGLVPGDRIILSDMSRFDGRERVRLK
jgi:HlyD family secretion protein